MREPTRLRYEHLRDFETLQEASEAGSLRLVGAVRMADGADVVLLCSVVELDGTDERVMLPLAVMLDGDPYAEFVPCDTGVEAWAAKP